MTQRFVAIALPNSDFDPTEVVVVWKAFVNAGFNVEIFTGNGEPGVVDRLLVGPGVIFGQLGALPENIALYNELIATPGYQKPSGKYQDIDAGRHEALILPGGHAKGMRSYLESKELQDKVVEYFAADKPVGSICHGGVVLARSIDPKTGRSVVHGRRMTALTKSLEQTAWMITAWKLGDYYRTYPVWVQQEVEEALGLQGRFETGPLFASYGRPFFVRDGKLVTGRWPGDAKGWAAELIKCVEEQGQGVSAKE